MPKHKKNKKIPPLKLVTLDSFDLTKELSQPIGVHLFSPAHKGYFKKINKEYGQITPFAGVDNIMKYIEACKRLDL